MLTCKCWVALPGSRFVFCFTCGSLQRVVCRSFFMLKNIRMKKLYCKMILVKLHEILQTYLRTSLAECERQWPAHRRENVRVLYDLLLLRIKKEEQVFCPQPMPEAEECTPRFLFTFDGNQCLQRTMPKEMFYFFRKKKASWLWYLWLDAPLASFQRPPVLRRHFAGLSL